MSDREHIITSKFPFFGPSFGVYTMVSTGMKPCIICEKISEPIEVRNPFVNYPNSACVPVCEEHKHLPPMILNYQTQTKGLFKIETPEYNIPRSDGSMSSGQVKWMRFKDDIMINVMWSQDGEGYEKGVKLPDFIKANPDLPKIEPSFNEYLSDEIKDKIDRIIKETYTPSG